MWQHCYPIFTEYFFNSQKPVSETLQNKLYHNDNTALEQSVIITGRGVKKACVCVGGGGGSE